MNSFFTFALLFVVISVSVCLPRIQKRDADEDSHWDDDEDSHWDDYEDAHWDNDKVEILLKNISQHMLNGSDKMEIDNFKFHFGRSFLSGELEGFGGSIGNLSTLNFVNVSLSSTSDSITVFVQVKLDPLEVTYSKFKASLMIFDVSGSLSAIVGSNLLTAQVTLTLKNDSCVSTLDTLKLTQFDGISVNLYDVKDTSKSFLNQVVNMFINDFTPEIKHMAEERMRALALPYVALACKIWS